MQQESTPTSAANPVIGPEPGTPLTLWQKTRKVVLYTLGGALAGVFAIVVLVLLVFLGDRSLLSSKDDLRTVALGLLVALAVAAVTIIGYILGDIAGAVIGGTAFGATVGGVVGFVYAMWKKQTSASSPTAEANPKKTT
jgi:membrane associated rhomboid family serine protease